MIKTERLILRQWRESDREPFARLNKDPRVLEFLLGPLAREESDKRAEIFTRDIDAHGWGFWAIEVPGISDFIGWVGLRPVTFIAHFTPAIEVGWSLLAEFWGKGYATEGARASLKYGFETLKLKEIVSFTVPANVRSRRVMEKIGMHRMAADDFDHPRVPEQSPLKRHVLYRLRQEEWQR